MVTVTRRTSTALAGITTMLALVLTGCGTAEPGSTAADPTTETDSTETGTIEEAPHFPVTVTDMAGNDVTIESADRVVITDNRFFQLAHDWDLEVVAAPRALMSPNNPMKSDESILDTGSHGEPDFEQVIAADPDLVINGYRYSGHEADMRKAAPDAAFVVMDSELPAEEYVVETVTLLGEIFGKQDEATALIDDFHAAVDAAQAAYDPETTVMGLVTSANEIRYSSHTDGRGASIFFNLIGMTPALDTEGSTNHQGDDISLEAIAEADADFFLVLDRDAAVAGDAESTPAMDLILGSASLANVPAVQNNAIYVMPGDYYLTEDIFAFTAVLDGLAEAFSAL